MISKIACLVLGDEVISTYVLAHMISNVSKIRHGLVYSDIRPRDRQNFSSCQKICREDVFRELATLEDSLPNTKATTVYLQLIRSVILAYHEKATSLTDRLYRAWLSVFICRFWRVWLTTQYKDKLNKRFHCQFSALLNVLPPHLPAKAKSPNPERKKTKQIFTFTNPCFFSIEINAHSLTFLHLLAIDGQIPFDSLAIDLFSSQTCESLFRSARAMSGVQSSIVNFTVSQFLRRSDKISVLQSIKTEHQHSPSGASLRFPTRHKHGQSSDVRSSGSAPSYASLRQADIEKIVSQAFADASDMIQPLPEGNHREHKEIWTMEDLSQSTIEYFDVSKRRSRPPRMLFYDESEESDPEEDDADESGENSGGEEFDDGNDNDDDDEEEFPQVTLDSSDVSYEGMRIKESINPSESKQYFKVRRANGAGYVFLHKQTACWILFGDKPVLSSDRLSRVMQGK